MNDICMACGKPIYLFNYDKARGVVGLTMAWKHFSPWVRHRPIPESEYGDDCLLVTSEHDAAVAAEWADHFEVRQGAVGSERLTVESMIAALRGPRPFGCEAGESDADT